MSNNQWECQDCGSVFTAQRYADIHKRRTDHELALRETAREIEIEQTSPGTYVPVDASPN